MQGKSQTSYTRKAYKHHSEENTFFSKYKTDKERFFDDISTWIGVTLEILMNSNVLSSK